MRGMKAAVMEDARCVKMPEREREKGRGKENGQVTVYANANLFWVSFSVLSDDVPSADDDRGYGQLQL